MAEGESEVPPESYICSAGADCCDRWIGRRTLVDCARCGNAWHHSCYYIYMEQNVADNSLVPMYKYERLFTTEKPVSCRRCHEGTGTLLVMLSNHA